MTLVSAYVFQTHTNKLITRNMNEEASTTMLMLIMTNDNDITSKFKATIRILFVLGRITVLTTLYLYSAKQCIRTSVLAAETVTTVHC